MTKRITAVILAMIFVLMLAPNFTWAMDSEPSNLTIVMEYDGSPLKGINVAISRVADAKEENGGVIFSATQEFAGAGADFSDLTKQKNIALAAVLDAYASANNIAMSARVTGSNGRATFTGLPAGLYLVAQRDGENSLYIVAPYLVAVPGLNAAGDGWDYDVVSYPKTEPVKREEELVSVSVFKIWKGTNNPPNNVVVQLYRNGDPYGGAVSLNAGNYWSYTWDSLNPKYTWTVDEPAVPTGYKKSVSGSVSTGFIITNTKTTGGTDQPPGPANGKTTGAAPRTWDASNTFLWTMLLITSSVGLLFIFCSLLAAGRILSKPRT